MSVFEHLYGEFFERARAAGAEVYRAAGMEEAKRLVGQVIGELKASRVALAENKFLKELDLEKIVRGCGAEPVAGSSVREVAAAELGISFFDLAIAETGTIIQEATEIDARLVSMLPPCYMALGPFKGLVATLREAVAFWAQRGEIPGYLAFISGPSCTADIERVLTIGVHGPARVIVVFIDEGEGER